MRCAVLTLAIIFFASAVAAAPALPVPPIPPAEPPLPTAPMPDLNARGPLDDGKRPVVTLDMGIHHRPEPDSSLGDPPGTRYRSDIDHRLLPIPGIMVHVPLP